MNPYTRRRVRTHTHFTRETKGTTGAKLNVYYPAHAHLYLGDATPLYLNWIVEDPDGNLYLVPAEIEGWSHRTPYNGPREQLKPVESKMRGAILEVLQVDADAFQRTA